MHWYNCGYCNAVPENATLSMCICCYDISGLSLKLDGPDHCIACIMHHNDFKAISLTDAILEMMDAYTRQQRGYGVRVGQANRYVGSLTNFPSPQKKKNQKNSTCNLCSDEKTWQNQPRIAGIPAGNLNLSNRILFGGESPSKFFEKP